MKSQRRQNVGAAALAGGLTATLLWILNARGQSQESQPAPGAGKFEDCYLKTFALVFALAAIAPGCGSRHEGGSGDSSSGTNNALHEAPLPPQYAFIQTNLGSLTLEEVTNRIGPYTRVGHLSPDNPELAFEFDLPDHTAVLVMLERPFDSRNRVHRVRHVLNTNDFHLFP